MMFIVLPFGWDRLKARVKWEVRKVMHYLSVVMGLAVAFHAPETNIFRVMGITLALWLADTVYVRLFRVTRIDTVTFTPLDKSTLVRFKSPEGFIPEGYVQLCVPFISRWEWHAFSIHASNMDRKEPWSCMCIDMKGKGSWTAKLHEAVKTNTNRPVWIQGPFTSPFGASVSYDKLICVASGVGITPSMHLVQTIGTDRTVTLIWICRDASMIEHYLDGLEISDTAWCLVFYTGKRMLKLPKLSNRILISPSRPDLRNAVCSLILDAEIGDHAYIKCLE